MQSDSGEVSDDEEEQDDTIVMNGDHKLERQNSKQGSLKRQIVKVGSLNLSWLLCFGMNGNHKLETQNTKQGSLKVQKVKMGSVSPIIATRRSQTIGKVNWSHASQREPTRR